MRLRPTEFAAAFLLLLTLVSPSAFGGPIDPLLKFQVIRTEHFVIYFHQGEEHLASSLATVAETVRLRNLPSNAIPPAMTHVVLFDQSEEANGWATPLPRNTIFLNAAVPSGSEVIGLTKDWLTTVFAHEYNHIVHLDRSRGWAKFARAGLGRNPIAFPNLYLPQWQIEGLATFQEMNTGFDGRLWAGDFLAVVRQDKMHRLSIDRASGGLVGWPDGQAAYAAGVGFHEYLVTRFGPLALNDLADATAGRLPYFGSGAFRRLFGESLGALWRDYERTVRPTLFASGDPAIRRVTQQGEVVLAPRFAPDSCAACDPEIIYASRTPHGFPTLRSTRQTGEDDRPLTTRYLGSTTGIGQDVLIFDQQDVQRSIAIQSDLYAYDRRSGQVTRLTYGSRLQDPDLSSDGLRLVAVREDRGRRDLMVADVSPAAGPSGGVSISNLRVLVSEADTQFSAPRWSPDRRLIAVERRRLMTQPVVAVLNADSGQTVVAWGGGNAVRAVTPTWRPDGAAIVAAISMASSPFELYELPLDDQVATRRITSTAHTDGPDGAFWPDISPDGRSVVFAGYTSQGYDVFLRPYRPETFTRSFVPVETQRVDRAAYERREDPTRVPLKEPSAPTRYSPFETLWPTSWTPLLTSDAFQTRLGGLVSGTDVLGRHTYTVDATWLTQRGYLESPLPSGPDWSASYAYTRWQPTFFGSVSRETQFRRSSATSSAPASTHAVSRQEAQAGVLWPVLRVRRSTRALVSFVTTRSSDLLEDRTVDARLVSARIGMSNNTSRQYGYSISREHGLNLGGTVEFTRRGLGATADADTATVDARAYVPGLGRHHVLALRAAAADARGDAAARQSFEIGVVSVSPSGLDFGSSAVGLFRGVVTGASHANRLVAASVEYRLPLKTIERGYGTLPLMLRTLHSSAFLDVVHAKDVGSSETRRYAAAGVELSLDAVIGYALPGSVSVGAAWTMPRRDSASDARVYLRLGRAF